MQLVEDRLSKRSESGSTPSRTMSEADETSEAVSADHEAEKERRARCRELARLGETKCKMGQVEEGVLDLEKAYTVGTEDLRLMSIVCSQLGNAYIDLKQYEKAVEKHKTDQSYSIILRDKSGEAKATCNLACAYRLLGRFKDAIRSSDECARLCRDLHDKEKEALAMYSLATCYHSLAKESHLSDRADDDSMEHSRLETTSYIAKAVQHYLYFLKLLDDVSKPPSYNTLRGRTYGNLGNLFYLQNDMDQSVSFHLKRLEIAEADQDREAVLRAHSNIANALLVGGHPDEAEKHYLEMEIIADQMSDKMSLAKALFGLATSCSIRRNYPRALDQYSKMQGLVVEQDDVDGRLKVLFGMTFANRALGQFEAARQHALDHFDLAEQIQDQASMEVARGNIDALTELIKRQELPSSPEGYEDGRGKFSANGSLNPVSPPTPTSDASTPLALLPKPKTDTSSHSEIYDVLEKSGRGRMEEQRAAAPVLTSTPVSESAPVRSNTLSSVDMPKSSRFRVVGKVKQRASLRIGSRSKNHSQLSDCESSLPPSLSSSPVPSRGVSPSPSKKSFQDSVPPSSRPASLMSRLTSEGAECEDKEMALSDFLDILDNTGD